MRNIIFSLLLICGFSAQAQQNLIERTWDGKSSEKNPVAAKKEIFEQAVEKVSEALIREIIGDAKYNRNHQVINSKIIKNSGRYIPFSKLGELTALPAGQDGFKSTANLKVSINDLQTLLLEQGLFYENDGTPLVVPLISFTDKVNSRKMAWWHTEELAQKGFLIKMASNFEHSLRMGFQKNNFYTLKPQQFHFLEMLPEDLRNENLRHEDIQALGQIFNAQIALIGDISFLKHAERSDIYQIQIKLEAFQIMNGRVVGQVTRLYDTDSANFEMSTERKLHDVVDAIVTDLANQILDVWQRGALGASLYRIGFEGPLPLPKQEALKEYLKNKVREIKNVRERLISAGEVTFEMDSAITPKDLSQKLPQFEFDGLKFNVDSVDEQELIYKVSK